MRAVLPDILKPGLKVVFCGTAAGAVSARKRAYYAGPGNRFWQTLHEVGLTPRRLEPQEFEQVLQFGIGLTDVAKSVSGSDADLPHLGFDPEALRAKIVRHEPKALAFNGKRAAREFFRTQEMAYGRQSETIGNTVVFVLPSTSGAARKFWDESFWGDLARFVRG